MEEHKVEHHHNKVDINGAKQIAGAILIVGILIAGAILLRGTNSGSTVTNPKSGIPIAKQIGLNVKTFDACVASGKFKEKVQMDIDDGVKAGVNGTPSSFILKDGKVVDKIGGAQPFEKIMAQINDAIKNEKTPLTTEIRPITSDDHIVGNINAKIIIVEYSDLDCPYCKVFHNTMYRIIKESNGDVAWVYRHYPIPQLHPNAFAKSEASECASEQKGNEGFWKYVDKVFEITAQ